MRSEDPVPYLRWPDVRIVFVSTSGVFASITRWAARSPVNHVYLEVPVWGRRMVCDATMRHGVRMMPHAPMGVRVVATYRCHFDTTPGIYSLMDQLGRPYDHFDRFGTAWMSLAWRWLRLKIKNWRWNTRAIKSSQLSVLFIKACNVRSTSLVPDRTDLVDMLGWCQTRPGWFERVQGAPPHLAQRERR